MIIIGLNRTKREAKRSDDQRISRGKKYQKTILVYWKLLRLNERFILKKKIKNSKKNLIFLLYKVCIDRKYNND